ncbi:DoxX family protein OS=Tsukamurella paurometabola OX=2061 GN=NCTC10741_02541 PE=4 SV=1 [Tsukamurella paurometabola]|uniref:hypothetical protein n=1 Tax=Tsukamurella paurometabola TaxID=2061 RepID=UPI00019F0D97|nr:hypothetical protein [Tsukamurella paurometabola]SUP27433.1 Uncharacterised protein [Tsukamurella paurometabola]
MDRPARVDNVIEILGSLLAVIAMGQVSLLNLFYDVPVKIVAWQLFAIAVLLTLRYREPLVRVALNRPGAEPVAPLPVAGAQRSWLRIVGLSVKYLAAAFLFVSTAGQGVLSYYVIHTPRTPLDGVWRATAVSVDGAPAALTDRTPWTNLAITMRGNVDNPVMKAYSTAYDSVVTQDVTGYTKAWLVEQDGEVLTLRKQKNDKPFPVTVRLDGDRLRLTTVLDGHRIESTYERRAMDRDASHIRLIQPDGPAGGTGPAPGN